MAYVLVSVDRVLPAIKAASEALRPKPNQIRGAWNREEGMLQELEAAATWSENHKAFASQLIALTAEERRLLEPYFTT